MERPLTQTEHDLISFMLGARFSLQADQLVEDMADGNMSSIRFVAERSDRRFGGEIGRSKFLDADGVTVFVSLNVDQHGDLFELDIWKTDFSPLQRIPAIQDIRIVDATTPTLNSRPIPSILLAPGR